MLNIEVFQKQRYPPCF